MKTRHGFVSNSSSSSFVMAIDKEASDKILPTLHLYIQAVVRHHGAENVCFGRPCVLFAECAYEGAYFEGNEVDFDGERPTNEETEGEMNDKNAVDAYYAAVKKAFPDKVFCCYFGD